MDLMKEILESPGILKELYGDLAKPGVKQVGKALSTVLGLGNTVLWPIALANEKAKIALEKNLEKYRENLKDIPESKISEVPPEVGVPIAEKLAYVTNDELGDMYIELLTKASSADLSNQAHPSFVNAINNLSPDEAILLGALKPYADIPFIEARLVKTGENQWITLDPLILRIKHEGKPLTYPNNLEAYFSNLEGLGIVRLRRDVFKVGENLYEPLEESAREIYRDTVASNPGHELSFVRGKIDVTSFGRMLIKACVRNGKD